MVSTDFIDYYELLEIPFGATDADIKAAYRRMARAFHPDMHPEDNDFYTEKFKEITEAYEVLSHPFKKGNYDVSYRRIVLQEFPEYEYYEDPTPEDTTVYTHKYTRRRKSILSLFPIAILVALVLQFVKNSYDNSPFKEEQTYTNSYYEYPANPGTGYMLYPHADTVGQGKVDLKINK